MPRRPAPGPRPPAPPAWAPAGASCRDGSSRAVRAHGARPRLSPGTLTPPDRPGPRPAAASSAVCSPGPPALPRAARRPAVLPPLDGEPLLGMDGADALLATALQSGPAHLHPNPKAPLLPAAVPRSPWVRPALPSSRLGAGAPHAALARRPRPHSPGPTAPRPHGERRPRAAGNAHRASLLPDCAARPSRDLPPPLLTACPVRAPRVRGTLARSPCILRARGVLGRRRLGGSPRGGGSRRDC